MSKAFDQTRTKQRLIDIIQAQELRITNLERLVWRLEAQQNDRRKESNEMDVLSAAATGSRINWG